VAKEREKRVITSNRKARRNYEVLETMEAGLVLTGTEVKSLRGGRATIGEAYVQIQRGEAFLHGMHVNPYEMGNRENHDPTRVRKLLLSKAQIIRLQGRIEQKGLTVIPLELYFTGPYAKVLLAIARGKSDVDRRHDMARRDAELEMRRNMRRTDR
jgi:SsrA-binding protein